MSTIKKILISQPQPKVEHHPYSDFTTRFGVEVDFYQFIRTEALSPKEFRAQHINPLDFTAVLFNSRVAIEQFFSLCEELRITIPEDMHYYCISEAVGNYLQKYIEYRKRRVFFGLNNRFEDVIPAMNRRPTEKYMMVTAEGHNNDVINMFASHKIQVTPVVVYRTVANEWPKEKPFNYDIVACFTPSGVQALLNSFQKYEQGDTIFAGFGANTVQTLKDSGIHVEIEAPTPECPSIATAINMYLASKE